MKTHLEMMKKHLEMFIDFKLNFREHSENMLNKGNKNIGLDHSLQGTQIISLISKLNAASSKILSFRHSSLNGINWTLKFKMLLAIIFSKRIF